MDKVKQLLRQELELLSNAYVKEIEKLSLSKIDASLPNEYKSKAIDEKIVFLAQNFKMSNPIYLMVSEDLEQVENSRTKNLRIFNVDPRYLESKGLKEEQIENFFKFSELVKNHLT